MAAGLPLANPAQQGVIAKGTIFPAFGNWIGTDQTLDLILKPLFGGNTQPANIVHNQPAGMPLATAVKNTLSTAFPLFMPVITISPNLILPNAELSFYKNLSQYAYYLKGLSHHILGDTTYPGVNVGQQGSNIIVTDRTVASSTAPKAILFQDLIGQPTWLGLNTVSVKTAMRGDITLGSQVTMPQTLAVVAATSSPQFRQSSAFQGTFFVQEARHVGRFRQPTGDSWVSIFQLAAQNTPQG